MKLSSIVNIVNSLVLTSAPVLVSGAPQNRPSLNVRDDYSWPQCSPTGSGYCTVYMATSDSDVDDYRTAVLFDKDCNPLQAFWTSKTNPKITLKGNLPNYVDLYVDSNVHPGGWVSYLGADTPLGETMACYKPPDSDGTGCRKSFACS